LSLSAESASYLAVFLYNKSANTAIAYLPKEQSNSRLYSVYGDQRFGFVTWLMEVMDALLKNSKTI
jgi:hypothetical protein